MYLMMFFYHRKLPLSEYILMFNNIGYNNKRMTTCVMEYCYFKFLKKLFTDRLLGGQ